MPGATAPTPAPTPRSNGVPTPPSKVEETRPAEQILGEALAHQMTQVALVDLRVLENARAEDYLIAAALLTAAADKVPDNQDILRLAIDAAAQSGENALVQKLNRRLVTLEPNDTRAQLTLIAGKISAAQTAEARLALYDAFLGPRGESIDPSVRSRLALDSALLLREKGDADGFVKRLGMATSLDQTNKEAAALACSFYASRVQDPSGQFEMLVNLLKADPLDHQTNLAIGKHLAQYGAHRGALRFYRNFSAIRERTFQPLDPSLLSQQYSQQWLVEGPEVVYKDLWEKIDKPRRILRSQREDAAKEGKAMDRLPDPTKIRLSFELSQVLAAAALAAGKPDVCDAALQDMAKTVNDIKIEIDTPNMRHSGLSEQELKDEYKLWQRETTFTALCLGRLLTEIEPELEAIKADPGTSPDSLEIIELWRAVRRKDASAKPRLEALAVEDPFACLALGQLAEDAGNNQEAATRYAAAYSLTPGTITGAWARTKASQAAGVPLPITDLSRAMEAQATGVPQWMDEMIERPSSFQSLSISPTATRFDPLSPVRLTVRIRNMSPIPLALGADAALNSRILLVPRISRGSDLLVDQTVPEVIKVDRRLRLAPREELVANVWAEPGFGGWLLTFLAGDRLREGWRAMQGFIVGESRVPGPGVFSTTVEIEPVFRSSIPQPDMTQEQLLEAIANAQTAELLNTLSLARVRMMQSNPTGKLRAEDAQAIAAALIDRYRKGDPTIRSLMLTSLPTGRMALGMKAFDRAIRDEADTDPQVLLLRLVTRADEPDDPTFALAAASSHPRLPTLAGLLRDRLKTTSRSYSRMLEPKRPGTLNTPAK